DWIEVTCTIEHAMGGKKQVSQGGPPDTGGAKNQLQARISTVTYLERATFKAACGLAEQGQDDDGAGGAADTSAEKISEAQRDALLKALGDRDLLAWLEFASAHLKHDLAAVADLPAAKFK